MTKDDVLTTTEVAALLGLSVRTVQLLIEGGSVASWKTPGGHRRVYRSDVKAFLAQAKSEATFSSALVIVIASETRGPLLQKMISKVEGATSDFYSDTYAAYFAMGSRLPAVVVVDLQENFESHSAFLESVALNPALGHTKIIPVSRLKTFAVPIVPGRTMKPVAHTALAQTVRDALRDSSLAAGSQMSESGFPYSPNEGQRLVALERSGLVDTAPEACFDRLTWLASRITGAPVALMTLLTADRQWFKSRHGLDLTESPRSWAFCNYTVLQSGVMVVEDLSRDARFSGNPVVVGEPHLRFYAGVPIHEPNGFALGSLCVVDYKPRSLDLSSQQELQALAAMVSDEIRLVATSRQLRWALEKLNRRPQSS